MINIINIQILYDFLIILINEIPFDPNQENLILNEKIFRILIDFIKNDTKTIKLKNILNKITKNNNEIINQINNDFFLNKTIKDYYDNLKKYISLKILSFSNIISLKEKINQVKEKDSIKNIKNLHLINFLKSKLNKININLPIIAYINNQNIYTRYFLTIFVNTILTLIFNILKKKKK